MVIEKVVPIVGLLRVTGLTILDSFHYGDR
jgi:hypothetical protein